MLLLGEAIAALEGLLDSLETRDLALACDSSGTTLSRMQAVNGVIFAKQRALKIISAVQSLKEQR